MPKAKGESNRLIFFKKKKVKVLKYAFIHAEAQKQERKPLPIETKAGEEEAEDGRLSAAQLKQLGKEKDNIIFSGKHF